MRTSQNQTQSLAGIKVVILAGGFGTRISEESGVRPKPMVEIGNFPVLWHIMKIYSHYGVEDFIIACGYKSGVIKEYFLNYPLRHNDVTFDFGKNTTTMHGNNHENWKITLVETGEKTLTGGRLKKLRGYIGNETFFMTYGDGLCDVDLNKLMEFHKKQKVLATVTAVQPEGRFGAFALADDQEKILSFREKPKGDGAWINGGYFVLEPEVLNYIEGDHATWEKEPMQRLAAENQLAAFRHGNFWHSLDTLRDKMVLEELWQSGNPPWKVW